MAAKRRLPISAEVVPGKGVHFRVWAPRSKSVAVELESGPEALESEGDGYFSGFVKTARAGQLYKYKLDTGSFPDPASRFQPEGPHGPSQIVDPTTYQWKDVKWKGVPEAQVIYEMHIGTFTRKGTYRAAMEHLPKLADVGITTLEIMPVADFPGKFGWGYDGVDLFAPTHLYGSPDDLRVFVVPADLANQVDAGQAGVRVLGVLARAQLQIDEGGVASPSRMCSPVQV